MQRTRHENITQIAVLAFLAPCAASFALTDLIDDLIIDLALTFPMKAGVGGLLALLSVRRTRKCLEAQGYDSDLLPDAMTAAAVIVTYLVFFLCMLTLKIAAKGLGG